MNSYINKINDFVSQLNHEVKNSLENISTIKIYDKGSYLLREGYVCKKSYFLKEGIARKFYIHDGKEITTEIYFADDIALSFDSYCLQKPASEFIQAITKITVSQTDFRLLQQAKEKFPQLIKLDLMLTELYAMWLEKRLFNFHTLNATQRYTKLIEEHPHIIQNIPLTYIASYLGISLETLSRIRSKI